MRIITLFLLTLWSISSFYGTAQITQLKEGKKAFAVKNHSQAVECWEMLPNEERNTQTVMDLGFSYSRLHGIELEGYTDKKRTKKYNQDLSPKRANQVYQYLKENGIKRELISYSGKGIRRLPAMLDKKRQLLNPATRLVKFKFVKP